jgi:hypothetical protein
MTSRVSVWIVRVILAALLVGVYLGSRVALVLLLARLLLAGDWCVRRLERDDAFVDLRKGYR